jgi:hypothetical protein
MSKHADDVARLEERVRVMYEALRTIARGEVDGEGLSGNACGEIARAALAKVES